MVNRVARSCSILAEKYVVRAYSRDPMLVTTGNDPPHTAVSGRDLYS